MEYLGEQYGGSFYIVETFYGCAVLVKETQCAVYIGAGPESRSYLDDGVVALSVYTGVIIQVEPLIGHGHLVFGDIDSYAGGVEGTVYII